MASLEYLDLAKIRNQPNSSDSSSITLDIILGLLIQQSQKRQIDHNILVERLERCENKLETALDQRKFHRKLRKIKYLIKDDDHGKTAVSKLEDLSRDLDNTRDKLRDLEEQLITQEQKLQEIADNAQVSAQYADYRQSVEDAKADFLVRQNSQV